MKPQRNHFARSRYPDSTLADRFLPIEPPLAVRVIFNALNSDEPVTNISWLKGNLSDGYSDASSDFKNAITGIVGGPSSVNATTYLRAVTVDQNALAEGDNYKVAFRFKGTDYERDLRDDKLTQFIFLGPTSATVTVDARNSTEDVTVTGFHLESLSDGAFMRYNSGSTDGFSGLDLSAVDIEFFGASAALPGAEAAAVSALGTTSAGHLKSVALSAADFGASWSHLRIDYTVQGCALHASFVRSGGSNSFFITPVGFGHAPSDIALDNATTTALDPSTSVGTFSATDADAGDTAAFSLVDGSGSSGNNFFFINGSALSVGKKVVGDHSIRVRVTDHEGLYFEKNFTITVEPPTLDISLGGSSVTAPLNRGGAPVLVGAVSLSVNGTGQTPESVSLVSGDGSTDNGKFVIAGVGNDFVLKLTAATSGLAHRYSDNNCSIRLRADFAGFFVEEVFAITVHPTIVSSGSYGGGSG